MGRRTVVAEQPDRLERVLPEKLLFAGRPPRGVSEPQVLSIEVRSFFDFATRDRRSKQQPRVCHAGSGSSSSEWPFNLVNLG